jgi:hypothetical protein
MQTRTLDEAWWASWLILLISLIDSIYEFIRIATIRSAVGSFARFLKALRVCGPSPQGCVGFVRAVFLRLPGFAHSCRRGLLDARMSQFVYSSQLL